MICPRKNDPRYKALVEKYGEVKAYHIYTTDIEGLTSPKSIREEIQSLLPIVTDNFNFYKAKYLSAFL